ncbi:MAG: hypothetical protein WC976_07200 [Caldisericia bacterium]
MKKILVVVLIYAVAIQPLLCELPPVITHEVINDALRVGEGDTGAIQQTDAQVQTPVPEVVLPVQKEVEVMEATYLLKNKIIVGDILLIDMINKRYIALVDKDGYAELPFIGRDKIIGKTTDEIRKIFGYKQLDVIVTILTVPQGINNIQNLSSKGVTCLGEFNRQSVVAPGTLSECIGNSFGMTQAANGIIVVHKRDQKFEIDYNDYLAGKYNKNISCETGTVLYAKKSPGAAFLDGVGPTLSKLRDMALVAIAFIELRKYGETEGWW